jgi:Arc/MetJ-type ribon-helix-helix transcriptional regulator
MCACQRSASADFVDSLGKSAFGGEGAIDGPNERLDYGSACWLPRKKVKSGRYNNASEVVREALRRMADDDERALRLANPPQRTFCTDPTEGQLDGIRQRVRASIEGMEAGRFHEYEGREGLKRLADGVKAGGRKLLARKASRK